MEKEVEEVGKDRQRRQRKIPRDARETQTEKIEKDRQRSYRNYIERQTEKMEEDRERKTLEKSDLV